MRACENIYRKNKDRIAFENYKKMEEETNQDHKKDFLEVNEDKLTAVYKDNIHKKVHKKFEQLKNRTIENQNFDMNIKKFKENYESEYLQQKKKRELEMNQPNSELNLKDERAMKNKIVAGRINSILNFDNKKEDRLESKIDNDSWYQKNSEDLIFKQKQKRSKLFQVVNLPKFEKKGTEDKNITGIADDKTTPKNAEK